MSPTPFAATKEFWMGMGAAALVGVLTGVACLVFLGAEHLMSSLIWGEREAPTAFFSGSWQAALILVVAAVIVGWLRHRFGLTGKDPNFIGEMIEGEVPLRRGLRYGLLGLVSLVGGASVGPEAPLGTLGGGIGTATAERLKLPQEGKEDLTFAGISGVFGGLGTFPFAGVIMALEAYHTRWHETPARMLPGIVSGTTALAVLFPVIGTPFIAVYSLGHPDLKVEWLAVALLLGILGAGLGLLAMVAMRASGALSARVRNPVVRGLVGGCIVAAIGFVIPLTMFSGRSQLVGILELGPDITVGLLAALFVGKLIAFVVSMRWGFFGGPIFPLMFLGALIGVVLHLWIPALPLAVAVPALAGALAVSLMPMPLMVMIITSMMFGVALELSVLPAVSVVTSFVIVRGTPIARLLSKAD